MENQLRRGRLTELDPQDVRMLVFDENAITVHLKNGTVLREEFSSNKALAEALSFWARKGNLFTDSQGPVIENSGPPPGSPAR